jgi:N-acetylmuramic acid 6-phosphate (MurNAc-6-P) etherase
LHSIVKETLGTIVQIQRDRPCGVNTTRIDHLERADKYIASDNKDQWTAINQLRRLVYMGAGAGGVLAFLGSILGAILQKKVGP